jgi:signal peptidase
MNRTAVHLRRLWSISTWVGTAVLFILLGSVLVMRVTGTVPLVEQTGSMAPHLTPGDLLLVKTVRASTVEPGDIVTFAHPSGDGRTITHRVTKIEPEAGQLRFTTKGDANAAPERWAMPASGNLGELSQVVPAAGRLTRPINDPKLRAVLIALMALGTTAGVLARVWRTPRPQPKAQPEPRPKRKRTLRFAPAREYR